MLNAMAPNRHHLQSGGAESPVLLAASSSPTPSIATVSISPSPSPATGLSPKQQQAQQDTTTTSNTTTGPANDCNDKSPNQVHQINCHNQATNTAISDTRPDIKSNKMHKSNDNNNSSNQLSHKQYNPTTKSTIRNQYETKAPITRNNSSNRIASTQSNQNHYSFPNNNSLYHSSRFSHHNQFPSNSKHHSLSYATRSSNQQRGHKYSNQKPSNSHHNHNHQHNHYNQQHQHNSSAYGNSSDNHKHHHHRQDLPLPFTSASSSSSLPGSDVTSSNSSVANQHATTCGPPHYVDLHVNAGECVSLQLLDGQEQVLTGPATITMISQQQNPPVPIPVQVPPGHMVHQIADENGTLKHIILSVMNGEEKPQLDSTIIDLPHGSFRVNSLGELVSVSGNLTGNEGDVVRHEDHMSLNAPQLDTSVALATNYHSHQLPQHQATTYYANYDGCPVANYATQDNSNIIGIQQNDLVDQQSKLTQDDTSGITDIRVRTSSTSNNGNPFDKSKDALSNIADTKQLDDKTTSANTNEASRQDTQDSKPAQDESQTYINNKVQSEESDPSMVISSSAQQPMVACVPSTISETVYPQHAMIPGQTDLGPSMLASGTLPDQMMTGAALDDQQMYCYQACCCCCYCSPETNAAMDVAPGHHQHAPVNGSLLGPPPESIMMLSAPMEQSTGVTTSLGSTSNGQSANRDSHSQIANGAYNPQQGNHMMVQGGVGMNVPLNSMSSTGSMMNSKSLHSLTGQNGLVPLHSSGKGGHYPDVSSHTGPKGHKQSRGGSNNTYKQHKNHSGSASGGAHGSVFHQKYGSQSYNNIVSGQSAYHQDGSGFSSSYKPPQSSSMSSHSNKAGAAHPSMQSNLEPSSSSSSTTLARVVSGGKHHSSSPQRSPYQLTSTGYRNNREPDNEHINSTQRTSRIDQHTSNSHINNMGNGKINGATSNSGNIKSQQKHQQQQKTQQHGDQQSRKHPASGDENTTRSLGVAPGRVVAKSDSTTIGTIGAQDHNLKHHQANSRNTSVAPTIGDSVSPSRQAAASRSKAASPKQSTTQDGPPNGSPALNPDAEHGDLGKKIPNIRPISPKNLSVSTNDDQSTNNAIDQHITSNRTPSPALHNSADSLEPQVQKQADGAEEVVQRQPNSGKSNSLASPIESPIQHRSPENTKKQQHHGSRQDGEIATSKASEVTTPLDQPKCDQPKCDQPKVDQPKVDHPKVDHPKVDHPKVDHPKVDHPKVDHPKVDHHSAHRTSRVKQQKKISKEPAKQQQPSDSAGGSGSGGSGGGGAHHQNQKRQHSNDGHHQTTNESKKSHRQKSTNDHSAPRLSNLSRQCRQKVIATLGILMQNSLSSCSDTKFAGLLLVIFTIFAMLLAIFIHYYIVAPVNE